MVGLRACHGPTPTSDRDASEGIPVKCPGGTAERCSASQDAKHFRGRDLMVRTTPEEKEIRRDADLSPTVGIEKQEGPGGERDVGPERPWEDQQRSEESEEEFPREQTKKTAPPQAKNTAKQPSHVPGGEWLYKVQAYWKKGRAAAQRHIKGPGEGEAGEKTQ
ncbi:hypothetical protein NDU88_002053 [Pleurodeles waltl]|uniref:Uncharacterized protein n=1 Tax=Pleurodeles waltl TaxID=8319 RepID=A0AAV7KR69_PLEWA|nr:hypothetical protein NDU88_002053 [Pleurodeles waltl]